MRGSRRKSIGVACILCLLLGQLGIHKFYSGDKKMGILYLLTGGLFGIGYIYDLYSIFWGTVKDGNGWIVQKTDAFYRSRGLIMLLAFMAVFASQVF